ncbi:Hypothetical predicted protein, partial [Pelobates cultripes]
QSPYAAATTLEYRNNHCEFPGCESKFRGCTLGCSSYRYYESCGLTFCATGQ